MPVPNSLPKFIESIVRMLVERTDAVSVTPVEAGRSTLLEVRVAPEDLGRVIGRQGRTSRSLRAVLAAATREQAARYQLEIIE